MHLTIARGGARVKAEHILTSQVRLNRLEHGSEIIMRSRVECRPSIANSEIAAAGLFGKFAETLGWRTGRQRAVTRRKERKVNDVKRDAAQSRCLNDGFVCGRTQGVQPIADQDDYAALSRESSATVESPNCRRRGVENRRPGVCRRSIVKRIFSPFRVGSEGNRQAHEIAKVQDSYARAASETRKKRKRCAPLLADNVARAAGC